MKTPLILLIASVVSFIWGFISWAILPWHMPKGFTDPAAVAAVLKANAPEHGMYTLPYDDTGMTEEGMKKMSAAWTTGPVFYGAVRPGPGEWSMSRCMSLSWAKGLLLIVLTLVLLRKLKDQSFAAKLGAAVLVYLIAGIHGSFPLAIWYESPWYDTLKITLDAVIEGALVGTVLARWA